MDGFLTELGKRLADRWLTLLVLPGALYLAVLVAAVTLGHTHPFDIGRLATQITTWATSSRRGFGGQVVLIMATLAGAAAAGLLTQSLGSVVERLWLAADWQTWPPAARHLAHWRVLRRRRRWNAAVSAYHQHRERAARARTQGQHADPAPRHTAWRRMTRIASEQPARPTWCGDRIHAVAVRVDRDLHLELTVVWPYLWLTMPDTTRAEITTARQALTRATVLSAWTVPYLVLAAWWWPAAPLAACIAIAGLARTRTATDTYALLLEAATRLHTRDLAKKLGVEMSGAITPEAADGVTRLLHSRIPPLTEPPNIRSR